MPESDRTIGDVLTDIVGDLQQIVRAEVRLARVELREEAGKAKVGAVLIAIGAVALTLSAGLALLGAVYALSMIWAPWVAALVVGGAAAVIGAVLAAAGIRRFQAVTLPPQKTVHTIAENLRWAKTRAR